MVASMAYTAEGSSVGASKIKTSTRRSAKPARTKRPPPAAPVFDAKAQKALKRAEDELWGTGLPPLDLLQELRDLLLLRCLAAADGNYAAAAALFGPSRQSVQQYANSPLRDPRWKPYQQNRRKKRDRAGDA